MKNGWPIVPLGEVIRHRKEFIEIDDLLNYKRCRVQLHAQGVVLRDEVSGMEIKTKKQQVCRSDEFLVAEIDAKLGGYGIVGPDLDGAIVSSHYFLFGIDESKLVRGFLNYFIRTPGFAEQVSAQGSTNYAAIRPSHVLGYRIPLPPIEEQRRVVVLIEALSAKIAAARNLHSHAAAEFSAALESARRSVFPAPNGKRVGDYAKLQSGYAFKSEWFSEDGIRLVRNANIGHGRIDWGQVARIPDGRKNEFDKFALREGDLLITLDRPIISTGTKVARVTANDLPSLLLQRVARVQFISNDVEPDYLFAWLQSPHFVAAIDPGRSNGVPHISPKDVERASFYAPAKAEQRRIVAYLDSLSAKAECLKSLQHQSAAELDALLPSVLDKAFKGEL